MLKYPLLLIFFFCVGSLGASLSLNPSFVRAGQITVLRVKDPQTALTVRSELSSDPVPLFDCPGTEGREKCALLAVPYATKAGAFEIAVGGDPEPRTAILKVRPSKPREDKLRVDPDRVHPTPEQQQRIDAEKAELEALFRTPSTEALATKFVLPTQGIVTSSFGNRRTFNGDLRNIHFGVDMRAALGVRIASTAEGRVVLAKELFYAGGMVVVDHGAGVFSSYSHLSKIDVSVGQKVAAGTRVGAAGATGRVTGPHLHWGMRVANAPVDPHQARKVLNEMARVGRRKGGNPSVAKKEG